MAAVPTIEAPTIPAGMPATPTISRNPSMGSLCSMGTISLYPAGDRTFAHGNASHTSRAPCSKNCTLPAPERPSSMAQLVESPMVVCCPHCSESFSLGKEGNAPKSPEAVSEKRNLTTEAASARLLRTIANLDSTLRKHGADLHQLELMMPRHISSPPSICSSEDLTAGVESKNHLENSTTNAVRSSLSQDRTSTRFPSNGHSDSDRLAAHPNHHSNLQNVHPLLYDAGDLKLLTASVSRLLKTLNYKVTNVTEEERALREEREVLSQEREIIAKERKELGRLRDEIDAERTELETRNDGPYLDGATPARPTRSGSTSSFNLFRSRVGNSVKKQRSMDNENTFGVPIGPRAVSFDVSQHPQAAWSPRKEDELKELQERLWNANKKWSDEQEEYLETLEHLKEEKRRAKKLSRRDSLKIDTDEQSVKGVFEKLGRQNSKGSFKSRCGSNSPDDSPKEKGGFLRLWGSSRKKRNNSDV